VVLFSAAKDETAETVFAPLDSFDCAIGFTSFNRVSMVSSISFMGSSTAAILFTLIIFSR